VKVDLENNSIKKDRAYQYNNNFIYFSGKYLFGYLSVIEFSFITIFVTRHLWLENIFIQINKRFFSHPANT
jgi:hypothetical protein